MKEEPHKSPELLAPGGSLEAIETALAHGADAVYAGVGSLNARVRARNLLPSQLAGVADYVHSFGARFYVALNVPLTTTSVQEACLVLAHSHWDGVDAVIMRDPILMQVSRKVFPGLPLHASTQCGVLSPTAATRMKGYGCSRIILPRELSLERIRRMTRAVPDVGFEVFVFGAMCFSVSGQCLLGQALAGRSGNYGDCAQVCRLPYRDVNGRALGRVFSMKDLDLVRRVSDLVEAGVCALKIEGRVKSPAWVGCAVHWFRRAIDNGGLSEEEIEKFNAHISVLFSRPRAEGFLDGRTSADHLVCRDVSGQSGLPIAKFELVVLGRAHFARFRTPVPLSYRDGLLLWMSAGESSIDGHAEGTPIGIVELRDAEGKKRMRVDEGEIAQVKLPPGMVYPTAMAIHSSNAIESLYNATQRHAPAAVLEGTPVAPRYARVRVAVDRIEIEAERGRFRHGESLAIGAEQARNEGLNAEIVSRYFGRAQYEIKPGLYVNPTVLRQVRRDFCASFERAYLGQVETSTRELADALAPAAGKFQRPDAELLASGAAAVSGVTDMHEGALEGPGNVRLHLRRRGPWTVVRAARKDSGRLPGVEE